MILEQNLNFSVETSQGVFAFAYIRNSPDCDYFRIDFYALNKQAYHLHIPTKNMVYILQYLSQYSENFGISK